MSDSNRKIIVIDDDRGIWQAYKSVLSLSQDKRSASKQMAALLAPDAVADMSGPPAFTLQFAAQGQEGFHLVNQALSNGEPYSVAFIDIRMPPGWDGMKTAAKIREIDANIEIVIVTAYNDRTREEIVRSVGTPDKLLFLRKPFDPEELYQFALSLTEKWNLVQQEKVARKALLDSELRFRSLVETTSDLVWEMDVEGLFTYCSPVCIELYGYRPEELEGKSYLDLLKHSDAGERCQQEFDWAVQQKAPFQSSERVCLKKDGTEVIVEVNSVPIFNQNDELSGFRGIDRNITQRVKALKEKQQLEEQYHQAQKMEAIGTLAGGIAHDLNNVLTPILGYSKICQIKLGKDTSLNKELELIEKSAEKAASLIRQILTFSRKQVVTPEICDLNLLIQDIVDMLRRMIRENIELDLQLSGAPWMVCIDSGQFEQILINLVVNARDAIDGNGRIVVQTSNVTVAPDKPLLDVGQSQFSGEFVLLSVKDNGSGMLPDIVSRIFDPFFTTKEVGKGTGLGLATVFGVAKQHEGHIMVESGIDQGTAFYIYLPRSSNESYENQAEEGALSKGGSETILLAEDDETVIEMISYLLGSLGYKVLKASNGLEGIEQFEKVGKQVDLLVTDVVMPGKGGSDLASTLRQERPRLPILFVSGHSREMAPLELIKSENVMFLQKPFKAQDIGQLVRDLLDGKVGN